MVYAGAGGGFRKGGSRYRGTGDFRSGFIHYLKGHGVLYLLPVTVAGYRLCDFQATFFYLICIGKCHRIVAVCQQDNTGCFLSRFCCLYTHLIGYGFRGLSSCRNGFRYRVFPCFQLVDSCHINTAVFRHIGSVYGSNYQITLFHSKGNIIFDGIPILIFHGLCNVQHCFQLVFILQFIFFFHKFFNDNTGRQGHGIVIINNEIIRVGPSGKSFLCLGFIQGINSVFSQIFHLNGTIHTHYDIVLYDSTVHHFTGSSIIGNLDNLKFGACQCGICSVIRPEFFNCHRTGLGNCLVLRGIRYLIVAFSVLRLVGRKSG